MTTEPHINSPGASKFLIPLLLVLIAAGLVGHYFNYPILRNIDFLFGGILFVVLLSRQFSAIRQNNHSLERRVKERTEELNISNAILQKTLCDLELHQIELKLQNQELRDTQRELESSEARYIELYDLAPIGYLTINEQGIILKANLTVARMLDTERAKMIGQLFSNFIISDLRPFGTIFHRVT